MKIKIKFILPLISALLLVGWVGANATETTSPPPNTTAAPGPQPSIQVQEIAKRKAPSLSGKGDVAKKNALAFIDWASASTKEQDGVVRGAMARARKNVDIVAAICDEAFAKQESDYTRALIALSLVGETKSTTGFECMTKFVSQPLPEKGTLVDGEILEQTSLAMLQAKAIDGLAYLHDEKADQVVLNAAGKNASRIVRAEAITAYLWNHNYDAKSQEMLKSVIRKDEVIFMDRLVKQADEKKESFNQKLAAYLKKHPEVAPPVPAKAEQHPDVPADQPPKF